MLNFFKSLFNLTLLVLIISCSSDDTVSNDNLLDGGNDAEDPIEVSDANDDGSDVNNDTDEPVDDPDTNDNNEEGDSFISVWELSDENKTIVLPIYDGVNTAYDFTIDWGDGTTASVTSFDDVDKSHTYSDVGEKTVIITGSITGFNFFNVDDSSGLLKSITAWGDLHFGFDGGVFRDCVNLSTLPDNSPNLDGITEITFYFFKCESFVGPVKNWDVANITSFKHAFAEATIFDEDISLWNVSNANSLVSMFSQASSFNQDISKWNVSNVLDFSGMFASATLFNKNISSWKVGKATVMSSMFSGANSFNQNISGWDVSNVTNMTSMFRGNLAFDQDISEWDTSNVTRCLNFAASGAILALENLPTKGDCL